jgi:hypothetical protein
MDQSINPGQSQQRKQGIPWTADLAAVRGSSEAAGLAHLHANLGHVGNRVELHRLRAGLSEQQCATTAGITVRRWRQIERGRDKGLDRPTLERVARAVLGMPDVLERGPQ